MTALLIVEGVAILLLAVLVVGLLRSHAEILRALHELGVRPDAEGSASVSGLRPSPRLAGNAPSDIAGTTPTGSTVHVGVTGSESRTLLAFLSTGCSSCLPLWESLRSENPVSDLTDTRLVVVTKGPEAESPSRLQQLAPPDTTVVQSSEAWDAYAVPVTPYYVLVDGATGEVVGEGSASTWAQVGSLIVQAADDREIAAAGGELQADRELRRAGIGPGHQSLYPGGSMDQRDTDE